MILRAKKAGEQSSAQSKGKGKSRDGAAVLRWGGYLEMTIGLKTDARWVVLRHPMQKTVMHLETRP